MCWIKVFFCCLVMCNLGFYFLLCFKRALSSLFACDQWVLYFHFSLAHRLYEYVLRWVGSGWAFSEHVYEREREEEEKKKRRIILLQQ